jgi:arylsulfatase A-like enzyme
MLSRREFLRASTSAVALGLVPDWRSAQGRPPNIVFILADDLGYADLSLYGRPDYKTPVLDAFARQGVRFTDAHTAAAVCTPTRVALMTGRYPARIPIGLAEPLGYGDDSVGLAPDHPTVASLLKKVGYDTSLVGKWHLGYRPEHGPLQHGFDEFFGILSGGVDYFSHKEPSGKLDLHEGLVASDKVGYMTDLLTARAVEVIRRRHRAPFYLALHYTAPHWPWEGPNDQAVSDSIERAAVAAGTVRRYVPGGSPAVYAEMMRSLDEGVGKVLAALGTAGLDRQTLVVFTSDNGGERFSHNAPYSFGKGTLYEGGTRVPAAMRWPGVIPANRVSTFTTITMDWSATLIAEGRATADAAYPLDGVDLLRIVTGRTRAPARTLFWRTRAQSAAREGRWKYLRAADGEHLFDLTSDPSEKKDLRETASTTIDRLRGKYAAWNAQMLALPAARG